MTEANKVAEKPIASQKVESPDVKRNPKGAGRKPKDYYTRAVQDIINGTAREAAIMLDNYIKRKRGSKKITRDMIEACKYVIDQAIGKARQKIEHSGGIMTYRDLANSAEKAEQSGRDILADVEEIANKYS